MNKNSVIFCFSLLLFSSLVLHVHAQGVQFMMQVQMWLKPPAVQTVKLHTTLQATLQLTTETISCSWFLSPLEKSDLLISLCSLSPYLMCSKRHFATSSSLQFTANMNLYSFIRILISCHWCSSHSSWGPKLHRASCPDKELNLFEFWTDDQT